MKRNKNCSEMASAQTKAALHTAHARAYLDQRNHKKAAAHFKRAFQYMRFGAPPPSTSPLSLQQAVDGGELTGTELTVFVVEHNRENPTTLSKYEAVTVEMIPREPKKVWALIDEIFARETANTHIDDLEPEHGVGQRHGRRTAEGVAKTAPSSISHTTSLLGSSEGRPDSTPIIAERVAKAAPSSIGRMRSFLGVSEGRPESTPIENWHRFGGLFLVYREQRGYPPVFDAYETNIERAYASSNPRQRLNTMPSFPGAYEEPGENQVYGDIHFDLIRRDVVREIRDAMRNGGGAHLAEVWLQLPTLESGEGPPFSPFFVVVDSTGKYSYAFGETRPVRSLFPPSYATSARRVLGTDGVESVHHLEFAPMQIKDSLLLTRFVLAVLSRSFRSGSSTPPRRQGAMSSLSEIVVEARAKLVNASMHGIVTAKKAVSKIGNLSRAITTRMNLEAYGPTSQVATEAAQSYARTSGQAGVRGDEGGSPKRQRTNFGSVSSLSDRS